MTVSELAAQVGVNPQTVRYYEREGLLEKPQRTESGYRDYDASALDRLRFIGDAKEVGFTLKQIRQLLGLDAEEPQSCGRVEAMIGERLEELEARLKAMRRTKTLLKELHTLCQQRPSDSVCPILKTLETRT